MTMSDRDDVIISWLREGPPAAPPDLRARVAHAVERAPAARRRQPERTIRRILLPAAALLLTATIAGLITSGGSLRADVSRSQVPTGPVAVVPPSVPGPHSEAPQPRPGTWRVPEAGLDLVTPDDWVARPEWRQRIVMMFNGYGKTPGIGRLESGTDSSVPGRMHFVGATADAIMLVALAPSDGTGRSLSAAASQRLTDARKVGYEASSSDRTLPIGRSIIVDWIEARSDVTYRHRDVFVVTHPGVAMISLVTVGPATPDIDLAFEATLASATAHRD